MERCETPTRPTWAPARHFSPVATMSSHISRSCWRSFKAGGTQKHLILTGLRGVGKTVLLNEFEFDCESAGWAGETGELSGESRIAHVTAKAARKALLRMSATKRAGDAAKRALRVLKGFTVSLGDLELNFDVEALSGVADSGDLADDLRDVFTEVGRAAAATTRASP
jgi:hypothetical protein